MFKTENASHDLATIQALYCVWIPANETPGAPLVSVWMDPMMRAFECQGEEGKEATTAGVALGPAEEGTEKSAMVNSQAGVKHSV